MRLFPVFVLVAALPASLQAQEEKEKRFSFTGVPVVDYSRSNGVKVGGMVMGFFPVSRADTVSPSSQVGGFGTYTGNKSWGAGVFTRLFWKEGTYRFTGGLGVASINFQYFDDELIPGGGFIDFNTGARFIAAEISRRVVSRLYLGVSGSFSSVRTEFDIQGFPQDTARNHINSLGVPLQWDSRDNVYNATSGVYAISRLTFNQEWLGSDYDYTTLSFTVNGYGRLSEEGVLAGRVNMFLGLGEVPFEGQRV
ncbi:MAG: BamA/TamA family outer membrane protein, partial [Longimicrobiales bacterium]